MIEHHVLSSGDSQLDLRVALADSGPTSSNVLLLLHGLPRAVGMGRLAAGLLPQMAENLANESGWRVATATLSGVGSSTGTFSAARWLADLTCVVDAVAPSEGRLALVGFGFGGALALRHGVTDERVRAIATLATPAYLDRWAGSPDDLYHSVIAAGVVADPAELEPAGVLYDGVLGIDPLGAIADFAPRRLIIIHGSDDADVPASDARDLLSSADGRAEIRFINGAGHQLRADPRMVATLLGWLDRQR
jgi:putative redox protein